MATQTSQRENDGFDGGPEGRPSREVAFRVFAGEFNKADLEFKEGGERSPSYLVTPLGARINRLLVVGVLTHVEQVGTTGDMWKGQIMDPTGVYNVYAGQYQPEAASALSEIKPPAVVAVVGKSRVYNPEEGVVYTSIRPETVTVVDIEERDRWVLDAAKQTMQRLDALGEALKLEEPTQKAIQGLGYDADLADGVARAIAHYEKPDLEAYAAMVRDGLEFLVPGSPERKPPEFETAAATAAAPSASAPAASAPAAPAPAATGAPAAPPAAAPAAADATPADAEAEKREEAVTALSVKLDDGKGAPWEDIVAEASKQGISEEQVEEALNALMDKGIIYEPVLGRLKKT